MTEHGFYHPSRGYWQTNSDVPQHILDTYPEGTVEVPLKPGAGFEWDGSEWVALPPDPEALKESYRQAVQAHIDATAGERGYEAGHTLAGYIASAVPLWQAEARAFVAWRDEVWTAVFATLAEIEAGETPAPLNVQALIDTLPAIQWPDT